MSPPEKPSILDTPEYRIEGYDKVTGRAAYVADLLVDGMLRVAFLRSPFAHARIVSIDADPARSMPGVVAILTGADVRPAVLGRRLQDWPILAWDTVRLVGDPVAAVAAETLEEAEAAAAAIQIEYEELPAIFDPTDALVPGAPILHPDGADYRYIGGERPKTDHPNIQGQSRHEHGDVDAAFASAAHVFEHTFDVARTYHGYLEPHASVVWMDGDQFHYKSTNKSPFRLRDALEASLDIPKEQLIVDAGYIGGDFGGKGFSIDDHILTFMTRATGRPVRSVTRYADDLRITNTRHAATIWMRTGVDAEGRIVAHETRSLFDGGAYAAAKGNLGLVPGGSLHTLAGYHVPAARIEVMTVYTNSVPGGHARAPGQPQNTFAAESHLDLIARALGLDPLEFRLRSAIRPGGTDVLGRPWQESAMVEVIETLRREIHWGEPLPPGRGRGMAIGARSSPSGARASTVVVSVTPEGRVEVLTAVSDVGGGAHTMIQRVIAEELGIPLDVVMIRRGTTAEAPFDLGVGGSRVTPVVGGAALAGARALRVRLDELFPGVSLRDQLDRAGQTGDVTVLGEFEHAAGQFSTYAFAAEVEVDRETGQVRVTDGVFVADVGTVINPLALRGQLVGGIVSGFGQALMEEVRIEDGVVTTANLGDYKMPTMPDTPPLRVVLITDHKGDGPFGAKSAGELGNVPIAPAIANAIADAAGVRMTSLPMTAEKVFAALRADAGGEARRADG